MGSEAGHRRGRARSAAAGLSAAHRCRHRASRPIPCARLVAQAEPNGLVLTSLMAKLRCESFAERARIPAFIFFFQMLYPFRWVNRRDSAVAAAAGGCMLVRARCAAQGRRHRGHPRRADRRLRLGAGAQAAWADLARPDRARPQHAPLSGIRRYPAHGGALGLCAVALFAAAAGGTVAGMALTYLAPPLLAIFGSGSARMLGGVGLGADGDCLPADPAVLRRSPLLGLRAAAIAFALHALHARFGLPIWRGRGGPWKGRVQANLSSERDD